MCSRGVDTRVRTIAVVTCSFLARRPLWSRRACGQGRVGRLLTTVMVFVLAILAAILFFAVDLAIRTGLNWILTAFAA